MNVKEEVFKAKVETFLLMKLDDPDREYENESPYLWPIGTLENIIVELGGLTEEENEAMDNDAIDYAERLILILKKREEYKKD